MSFPHYQNCKDSGVEWLAAVPQHWQVRRIKNLVEEPLKYGANESADIDDPALPRFVRITDIDDAGRLRDETFRSLPLEVAEPFLLKEGDVLLARSGATVGKSFIYAKQWGRACFAGYLIRARLNQAVCQPRWLYYFCQTTQYWDYVIGTQIQSTIQNVSAEKYANLFLPLPALCEQNLIVAFLDRETAKIDGLVDEQRRLMELLGEKRQAVTSHAVTNGLNPDAPMKPSGIEWLGDVPAHWHFGPLKRYWGVTDCKHVTADFVQEGIPLASIGEVQGRWVDLEHAKCTTEEFFELLIEGSRRPLPGDLIFSRNATVGEVAQVRTEHPRFAMGQDVVLLRKLSADYSSDYLQHVIRSAVVVHQLAILMIGSTFKRINVEEIRSIVMPSPPPHEQDQISAYLVAELERNDALTAEAQRSIDLLQERRTALISAAVTGQIDVRSLAEAQPA